MRIARETGWGYTRIRGELKKLAVKLSRSTVVNILHEHGIDPGPKRGAGTWADFIQRHAQTLWACDFFSMKVLTTAGLVDYFVLFFIEIGTRRVHIAGVTRHPEGEWVTLQARNLIQRLGDQPHRPKYLIRDWDSKFTAAFDTILASAGVDVIAVGPRAPNLNAYAERWVLSIKSECLNHFLVFGEAHLRHLIDEYTAFYNTARPHQGLGNQPLTGFRPEPFPPVGPEALRCEERLGGLLKHYRRAS